MACITAQATTDHDHMDQRQQQRVMSVRQRVNGASNDHKVCEEMINNFIRNKMYQLTCRRLNISAVIVVICFIIFFPSKLAGLRTVSVGRSCFVFFFLCCCCCLVSDMF